MRSCVIYEQLSEADGNFPAKAQRRKGKRQVLTISCSFSLRLCAFAGEKLLSDRSAGDASTGVSRRIRLHVVGLLVDDQRCAAIREERVWTITHIHVHVDHRRSRGALLAYHEVVHVTG